MLLHIILEMRNNMNSINKINFINCDKESQNILKNKIKELIQMDNIKPCHSNQLFTEIEIYGALDNNLNCNIKCSCDNIITSFTGNTDMSKITFTYNQA